MQKESQCKVLNIKQHVNVANLYKYKFENTLKLSKVWKIKQCTKISYKDDWTIEKNYKEKWLIHWILH